MISRHIKRSIGACFIAGLAMTSVTGCSNKVQADSTSEVVVLENQQQEIKDVLAVKKITPVKGFRSIRWVSDTKLIGETQENGIPNISIYDMEDGSLTQVTKNTRPEEEVDVWLAYETAKQGSKYVLYKEVVYKDKLNPFNNQFTIYAINLETHAITYIGNGIGAVSSIEDDKVLFAKGIRIFEYNLVIGEEEEICLPESLITKMKAFPTTHEGYMDMYNVPQEDRGSNYYQNNNKESFKSKQEHYDMIWVKRKGDELNLRTQNLTNFIYNRKTGTYTVDASKVINRADDDHSLYPRIIKKGLVESVYYDDGVVELWKIDQEGNRQNLIDEGMPLSFYPSPDNQKLVYMLFEQGHRKIYIYDHNSGGKIALFGDCNSAAFWNDASDKFLYLNRESTMKDTSVVTTNIVTLN